MRTGRRYALPYALALLAATMGSARAQEGSSLSSPVCGLINFSFCDQRPPPSAPVPPPTSLAPGRPLPPPPSDRAEGAPGRSRKTAVNARTKVAGNCATGWFTTMDGERLQFIGPAKRRLDGDPRYVILHDGLRMDDASRTEYRDALRQFKTLCPKRVPVADD